MHAFYSRCFVLSLLTGLGACVGSSKYACPGMPEGITCASAHEVYEITGRGTAAIKPSTRGRSQSDMPVPMQRREFLPEMSGGVIPLRTPAKVMRIWVGLWESENGDLHVPGLIYTEIEPRRWQAGLPAVKEPSDIILLEPRPAPAAPKPPATAGNTAVKSSAPSSSQAKSVTGDK